ncbi:MAG: plastocyanin/azurin family copper-binding protein [Pseudomonadota bacterium]
MYSRRRFILLSAAAAAAAGCGGDEAGDEHRVLMLGQQRADQPTANAFDPLIMWVNSGDRVTFVPTQPGHQSASSPGMIPAGAEPWNGNLNVAHTVTLTVPGIYGYICVPHYHMGMVGVIVVGGSFENIAEAREVAHPPAAAGVFERIFAQLTA